MADPEAEGMLTQELRLAAIHAGVSRSEVDDFVSLLRVRRQFYYDAEGELRVCDADGTPRLISVEQWFESERARGSRVYFDRP